jgi:hypothetical protein
MKTYDEKEEFDGLMEEVKRRTENLQRALSPVLSQLILADIRKQHLPYGMPDNDKRIQELNALDECLKKMVDEILGFSQRKSIRL